MSKDDLIIEAYKEIIAAQQKTIDSLLAVIKSLENYHTTTTTPYYTITGSIYTDSSTKVKD